MTFAPETTGVDPPPIPKRRRVGCLSIAVILLSGTAAFVLGTYGLWRWSNARGVERLIAEARDRGEPTTIEELDALDPRTPESEEATKRWTAALAASQFGDYELRRTAWAAVSGTQLGSDGIVEAPTPAELSAIVSREEVRRAIELGELAAEHGMPPSPLTEASDGTEMPYWQEYSTLVLLLAMEVEHRRESGYENATTRGIETLLAVAQAFRRERAAWMHYKRDETIRIASLLVERAIERHALSTESLARLHERVLEMTFAASLGSTLAARQVFEIRRFRGLESSSSKGLMTRLCPEETVFIVLDELRSLRAEAADPWASPGAARNSRERVSALMAQGSGTPWKYLAQARFGAVEDRLRTPTGFVEAMPLFEARLRLLEAGIACERYREERGELPEWLGDLPPEWLVLDANDPFGEVGFDYRADELGYDISWVGSGDNAYEQGLHAEFAVRYAPAR